MSRAIDPGLDATGDRKSTEYDTKSTEYDMKSTAHDILTTLGDTFTTRRNSDLRRIASDFLTSGFRMGETNPKPTDEREFHPRHSQTNAPTS